MTKHITVHVSVSETQETEKDQYGKVTQEHRVTELAKLTVRADSVEGAHRKVRAVMAGALPLGDSVGENYVRSMLGVNAEN